MPESSERAVEPDLIVFDDTPTVSAVSVENQPTPLTLKDDSFELSNLLSKANEDLSQNEKNVPSFFAEETVTPQIQSVSDISLDTKQTVAKPLEDPNAILNESIARLDALNDNHELVKQAKIEEVANINKQIAALKKEGAQLGKEIDQINAQQEKVAEMKKLFESQKAS